MGGGWNLAWRIPSCQISPCQCRGGEWGPKKLNYWIFPTFQNMSLWAYPLQDFLKLLIHYGNFHAALCLKFVRFAEGFQYYGAPYGLPGIMGRCPDLFVDFGTRSIQSYGCLLTGSGYPQIFSTPSSKTIRWTPNVFKLQEHAQGSLSPCQVWWGLHFARHRGIQSCWGICHAMLC